jgi:hypothetical protein
MIEFAVTAVVATVAVPDARVTLPKLLAPAAVVVATLVLRILLPDVPNTRLPLFAVIAPAVAVIEVPAVTVVPAATDPTVAEMFPAEATILPVVDVTPLPAVTVVAADKEPIVEEMLPVDATIFPVVAITPVPPVSVVVVVKEPGVVIAAGRLTVTVDPEAAVVIWEAVPAILMLPAVGDAVPVSPVNEERSTEPPASPTQFAVVMLEEVDNEVSVYTALLTVSTQTLPTGYKMSVTAGARTSK